MANIHELFHDLVRESDVLLGLLHDQTAHMLRTKIVDDLDVVVETLRALIGCFVDFFARLPPQDEKLGVGEVQTALKQLNNVLTWTKFQRNVASKDVKHKLLFRAHTHRGAVQPTFTSDLDVTFDLNFKRTYSVDEFVASLDEHLGKTRKEEKTKGKVNTQFVSMSSKFEWALHAAGQRPKRRNYGEAVGLAIFDIKKLKQNGATTLFRVKDILDFLDDEGKGNLIQNQHRKWAQNCDEYVSLGRISDDGLVKWIVWEEIRQSPGNILLNHCFVRAYTLGKYREWLEKKPIQHSEKLQTICDKIIDFGKLLAGRRDDLVAPLVGLICAPRLEFWGIEIEPCDTVSAAETHPLVDEVLLGNLSELKISSGT